MLHRGGPSGPALISLARFPLGLGFALCLAHDAPAGVTLGSAMLAALSDVVDGRLARRLGIASPGGARLDVLADAWFVLLALGALAAVGALPWSLPLATALSLGSFLSGWRARVTGGASPGPVGEVGGEVVGADGGEVGPEVGAAAGARRGADRLGHLAGVANWTLVLAGAAAHGDLVSAAPVFRAGLLATGLNLLPVAWRIVARRRVPAASAAPGADPISSSLRP